MSITTPNHVINETSSCTDGNEQYVSEPEPEPTNTPIPYTTLTKGQKRFLGSILSLTMLASPLTATIYLPLLPLLADHFRVSAQSINLTITIYIIFQAISPLLFATSSNTFGRRPIYLITYSIYTIASLGLALNKTSYPALLILRAVQSLGASSVLAVAYGVVADICIPAERGSMLGPMMGAANLAVCIGPVIGGCVALGGSKDYQWVFWALLIFGATILMIVGFLLPETARELVGNGSIPPKGWSMTWYSLIKNRMKWTLSGSTNKEERELGIPPEQRTGKRDSTKRRCKIPNPLNCLAILFWKDTAVILWMAASPYAVYYCVQTSIPSIFKNVYGFNELKIGLSYLPGGVGVVLGGYLNGKLMDRNYAFTAKKIGRPINRASGGNDLDDFPIEKARARGCWILLAIYILSLAGYGWAASRHIHESLPLILQFILAVLCTCFQQTFNALLVDLFPSSPGTAAAASNITRCVLSAVAVAIMQPLVDAMGIGWFFSLLALISGGGGLAANFVITRFGMAWRGERLAKMRI